MPTPDELVAEYVDQTLVCSVYSAMRRAPAHDPLIAMGDEALPALLRALQRGDGGMCLMHVLGTITHEWPSAPADKSVVEGMVATNVSQARELWCAWGRERGYLSAMIPGTSIKNP